MLRNSLYNLKSSVVSILFFATLLTVLHVLNGSKLRPSNFMLRSEFSGFKLYRVKANTPTQFMALRELLEAEDVDFWKLPEKNEAAEVMVGMEEEDNFLRYTKQFSMNYSVVIENIEKLVSQQYASLIRSEEKNMSWTEYHYPETIFSWVDGLRSRARSGLTVDVTKIGETLEGRPMKLIRITAGDGTKKPSVFIDGGHHAREWISPATVTYIVDEITTNPKRYEDLLSRYDFHIVPLMNPDGYSHSCDYNRLWRKSRRSSNLFTTIIGCCGIDLNRNFGFSWGGRGSGSQPCSMTYAGTEEFSEPETASIRNYIDSTPDTEWIAYFSLHSFGQKWLTPWGFTSTLPDDYKEMIRVAKIGAEALERVHGTRYSVGSTNDVLYTASGSSSDWFKGSVGTKYSYTLELRDRFLYGFLLPAAQIKSTGEETWAGICAALRAIPT